MKAYAELHKRNVLHGDVRPSNVLVSDNGCVYIIDFETDPREREYTAASELLEVKEMLKKVEAGVIS